MSLIPVSINRPVLAGLIAFHILIIIVSNYLVQLPVTLFGWHTTWGAFSFPFIFLATDLTVRLMGKVDARRVIARVMLPALVASYGVSVLFNEARFGGLAALGEFNLFVFRIAVALDTYLFFSVAFWRSDDPFMAANWVEIATVDYAIKLIVSLVLFVPLYGVLLSWIVRRVPASLNGTHVVN